MKAQLNVRLDALLVRQVQKAAKQEGRVLAACVAMALEQWLAAPRSALQEPVPSNRLDDLEMRLERLEQQKQPLAKKVQLNQMGQLDSAKPLTIVPAGEAITTAALAELLAIKRGALNARIRRAGGVAPGLMLESWCCLGLVVPEGGGQAQALWQHA